MNASMASAVMIKSIKVDVGTYRLRDKFGRDKFGYYIYGVPKYDLKRIITCDPIYDSEAAAEKSGQALIDQVKSMDIPTLEDVLR